MYYTVPFSFVKGKIIHFLQFLMDHVKKELSPVIEDLQNTLDFWGNIVYIYSII